MTILQGNKRFAEFQFKLEDEFEELVREQSKTLFGKDTIFIYTKRKLKGVALGSTIPVSRSPGILQRPMLCRNAG